MTDPRIPVTEDELHAYVDNELPAERRGDVEAWLAAHPDDAERVRSWRAMAEMLHARYDAVANEPVPKRLELERLEGSRANGSTARSQQRWWHSSPAAVRAGWHMASPPPLRRSRASRSTRSMRIGSTSSRFAIPSRCRATNARICSSG